MLARGPARRGSFLLAHSHAPARPAMRPGNLRGGRNWLRWRQPLADL